MHRPPNAAGVSPRTALAQTAGRELTIDRIAERRQVLQRVQVVHLAKNLVGQPDTGDVPAPVAGRTAGRANLGRVLEILVERLEEAEMRKPERVGIRTRIAIGSEEDAVLGIP